MKTLSLPRKLALAALALGAVAAGTAAHARSDVFFSIGVQAPGVYVQPAPVYNYPAPVYVQPRPVYVQPAPVYGHPRPVYRVQGHNGWEHDRGRYDQHGWNRHHDDRGPRHGRRYGPYGDLDRDGVMNQDDRDRDGDGVRNRRDRAPMDPYRY